MRDPKLGKLVLIPSPELSTSPIPTSLPSRMAPLSRLDSTIPRHSPSSGGRRFPPGQRSAGAREETPGVRGAVDGAVHTCCPRVEMPIGQGGSQGGVYDVGGEGEASVRGDGGGEAIPRCAKRGTTTEVPACARNEAAEVHCMMLQGRACTEALARACV